MGIKSRYKRELYRRRGIWKHAARDTQRAMKRFKHYLRYLFRDVEPGSYNDFPFLKLVSRGPSWKGSRVDLTPFLK
jgi:hypothetical protein